MIGARQVWFLGTDEGGRITLYRGLPYDLPLGIALYSENESIALTLDALPEERRAVVTEHELRSRDDAVSLVEDLQQAAIGATIGGVGTPGGGAAGGAGGTAGGAGTESSGGTDAGGAEQGSGAGSPAASGGAG